jgi:hypothetical protein
MQEFAVRLDGCDHARRDVAATQKPPDFCLDAGPGAVREFSQQTAVEARVEPQTLGNGQHNLPVRDRGANFFSSIKRHRSEACGARGRYSVGGLAHGTAIRTMPYPEPRSTVAAHTPAHPWRSNRLRQRESVHDLTCTHVYLLAIQGCHSSTYGCKLLGSRWLRLTFLFQKPFPSVENLLAATRRAHNRSGRAT